MYRSLAVAFSITVFGFAIAAYAQSLSQSGATATPGAGSLTDSSGNVWSLNSGGQIVENGSVIAATHDVVLLLYYNDFIYQETSNNTGWWEYTGTGAFSGWTQVAGDPRTGGGGSSSGTTSSGPNPCINYYTSSIAVPGGYGAAYDLFSSSKELLVNVDCSGANPALAVGSGSQNQYIYKTGYVYRSSAWQPVTLGSSSSLISNAWYSGSASASLGGQAPGAWTYAVGYVCQWNGTTWQCGCADTACTTSYWQLQAFENASLAGGSSVGVPVAAAAAGYTYQAMDIENWTQSDLDMGTGGNGFLWYNDGVWNAAPTSALSITNGLLTIATGDIATGAQTNGTATLNPSANWVGTGFGPGFYVEFQGKFDPSLANGNGQGWPGFWGNTFSSIFNGGGGVGGVEVDWSEFYWQMLTIPSYNTGIIDWSGTGIITGQGTGSNFNTAPNLNNAPFSNGDWNFNTMHTYSALLVPSQENGGTGYLQSWVDGHSFAKLTWKSGDDYSRLDTDPFLFEISAGTVDPITLGHMRVFVKDASKITKTF